jgi:serine/threonine-protein kinase
VDSGTLIAGRYRLDRSIDSGAMGAVWSARDERLRREVAVKILLPGLDGADERFEREAQILASLKGPNYVEVYDFGEELDGDRTIQFLAMELVEGVSLARLLAREGNLDPARTMRITAEAADALGAAHRKEIVHRDVKPANLLIDADNRVRLVDFGISLLVGRSRLTDSKEMLGTVPYVSPERLRNQDVTGKSDLYSLGAVAYECLTGTPPFPSQDPMAVIHSHLYDEPPALPDSIPPQIAAVVMRSLRKAPGERWESGEELAAACRAAVTGQILIPAPPEPQTGPTEEGPPRNRKRLALIGIATAMVLAVLAIVVWNPWKGDAPGIAGGGDGGTSTATGTPEGSSGSPAATEEATSSETATVAETATEEGEGGPEGDSTDETDSEDDTSDNDTGNESGGEVPPVTGMTTFEARDHLEELGFTNVVAELGWYNVDPEPEHCEVVTQNPASGETVDYSAQISLSYHRRTSPVHCEW